MGLSEKINQRKYDKLVKQANSLFEEAKFKESKERFEAAFEFGFSPIDYMRYACVLCQLEEYSQAIDVINQLLGFDPPKFVQGWAHALLGDINFDLCNQEKAIEEYEKAMTCEDFSMDAICFLKLGTLYDDQESSLENDDVKKAYDYLLKAKELNENLIIASYEIGTILLRSERAEEALEYFNKVEEVDKEDETDCHFRMALCYEILKNNEKAKEYLYKELKHKEPNPATLITLGLIFMDEGNMEKAKDAFLEQLKNNSEDYIAWYDLGCVYALINDYDNANECFKIIKYKSPNLFHELISDPELSEYIKSDEYNKLINE